MDTLFMLLGFLLLFVGLPATIVWLIIRIVKRKTVKLQLILIPSCVAVSMIFIVIGAELYGRTDEYQQQLAEEQMTKEEELAQKEKELVEQEERLKAEKKKLEEEKKKQEKSEITVTLTAELTKEPMATPTEELDIEISPTIVEEKENSEDNSVLTEEEYKNSCTEMWYDDVFFSESSFKGKNVKLHVFLEEAYYFTADDLLDTSNSEFCSQNNLYRSYYKCGVSRKDENSYIGGQIDVFFNQDYGINPSDYECGDKLVMYGEVVHCATTTWDGCNRVYFIPKYVEEDIN